MLDIVQFSIVVLLLQVSLFSQMGTLEVFFSVLTSPHSCLTPSILRLNIYHTSVLDLELAF